MIQLHLKKFVNECIDHNPTVLKLVDRVGNVENEVSALRKEVHHLGERVNLLDEKVNLLDEKVHHLGEVVHRLGEVVHRLGEDVHRLGIMMEAMRDDIKIVIEAMSGLISRNDRNDRLEGKVQLIDDELLATKGVLQSHVQNSRIHLPN